MFLLSLLTELSLFHTSNPIPCILRQGIFDAILQDAVYTMSQWLFYVLCPQQVEYMIWKLSSAINDTFGKF